METNQDKTRDIFEQNIFFHNFHKQIKSNKYYRQVRGYKNLIDVHKYWHSPSHTHRQKS